MTKVAEPLEAATSKLPLQLVAREEWSGYRIVDARGRSLCMLYDWYEEGGVQHTVSDEEVRAVGEWMVAKLNATQEVEAQTSPPAPPH
jgi:hypothetical protein